MVGGDVPWKACASRSSFGHTGAGGCVSFGDADNEVLFVRLLLALTWPPRCSFEPHQLFGHDALVFKSRVARALSVQFTPHQLAFAFVANKMQPGLLGDYRSVELIESAYACLARVNFSNAASVSKL
jgi:hypothetical protein